MISFLKPRLIFLLRWVKSQSSLQNLFWLFFVLNGVEVYLLKGMEENTFRSGQIFLIWTWWKISITCKYINIHLDSIFWEFKKDYKKDQYLKRDCSPKNSETVVFKAWVVSYRISTLWFLYSPWISELGRIPTSFPRHLPKYCVHGAFF
jgi:hypothetical protein